MKYYTPSVSTENSPHSDQYFSIANWLSSLELGQYADGFAQNGITLELLISLTESDLARCGVSSLGHQKRILLAIEQLKKAARPHAGANPGPPPAAHVIPRKPALLDRFGGRFLYISIFVHVLFGLIATWFVVQRIEAKRKLTFQAGAKTSNPNARAIEHKVQITKKKNSMSMPTQSRRITVSAVSARVALPEMALPMTSEVVPGRMEGAGAAGLSLGTATMAGSGGGGGKGGGAMPFFGLPSSGVGLKGSFYDLKQTKGHQPTDITNLASFIAELNRFETTGWRDSFFSKYFKAHQELFATQIFVPKVSSSIAPKEFGVEKDVKPAFWMALYKGQISPPESGIYHFVGGGDNILVVRLNGKVVLDRSWDYKERFGMDKEWSPVANYDYNFANIPKGFAKGNPLQLSAGQYYPIEILIGDDGGSANFSLLVQKEGVSYEKTSSGLPILPVLRFSQTPPPPGEHPPFQPNGPVWRSRAEDNPMSIFKH